jgi:hypothetical protein
MNFNDLPTDIIERIFYMHVYVYRQFRKPLLVVCRRWHTVASNHSLLWKSITLWGRQNHVPVNIDCNSLRELAQVIKMAGTATFDFGMGTPVHDPTPEDVQLFVNSVDKNWLSRCQTFTLWAPDEPWKTPDANTLGDLLLLYSYDSLETLELNHTGTQMWKHMLACLMARVEATSPNLRSLKIDCGIAVEEITKNVLNRPSVLRRVQTLEVSSIDQPISWSDFENLQELRISHTKDVNISDLNPLTVPGLTRFTLEDNCQRHDIPFAILPQLTHLTLDWFQINESNSTDKPLSLPSLISLTYLRTGFEVACLDAPHLEEFTFQVDPYDERPYSYPLFAGATSSPRVIRLDILSNESDEEFSDPLPMWRQVEELHLTTFKDIPLAGTEFLDILCGYYSERTFPKLRHLTILHPSDCGDGPPSTDEKNVKTDEARSIMEARADAGLKPFERLEVGWYWTNDNEYVLEDQTREWWATVWKDCLQKVRADNDVVGESALNSL